MKKAHSPLSLSPGQAALVILLALSAGGCTDRVAQARRAAEEHKKAQEQAAAQARESGWKLTEKDYRQGKAWSADLSGQQLPPDSFERLKKVGYITELNLSKTNVTDADMATIGDRSFGATILRLDLSHTAVTDAGLQKLADLPLLMNVNATGTKVTAEGIKRFQQARIENNTIPKAFKATKVES